MTDFKRIYLDTSPIIYYLEHSSLYMEKIKHFFEMCLDHKIEIVTSTITIEEYLVQLRQENAIPCMTMDDL